MADRFMVHEKFGRVMEMLDREARRDFAEAIIMYGSLGIEVDIEDFGARLAFEMARDDIDYSRASIKTGARGGRPKRKTDIEEKPPISDGAGKPFPDCAKGPFVDNEDELEDESAKGLSIETQKGGFIGSENPPFVQTQNPPFQKTETQDKVRQDKARQGKRESKRRFTPPTPAEVEEYARERGHPNFAAERFVDYYASKGWMVGKSPMRDWRAAVRNWLAREEGEKSNDQSFSKYDNLPVLRA